MPAAPRAAIPAAHVRTLLEWIDIDDGDTTSTQPACSADLAALHAQIILPADDNGRGRAEPLQPPAGLYLAPLG
jgi:hypothetical protein